MSDGSGYSAGHKLNVSSKVLGTTAGELEITLAGTSRKYKSKFDQSNTNTNLKSAANSSDFNGKMGVYTGVPTTLGNGAIITFGTNGSELFNDAESGSNLELLTVDFGGSNYKVGDTVTVSRSDLGSSASNDLVFTLDAESLTDGVITSLGSSNITTSVSGVDTGIFENIELTTDGLGGGTFGAGPTLSITPFNNQVSGDQNQPRGNITVTSNNFDARISNIIIVENALGEGSSSITFNILEEAIDNDNYLKTGLNDIRSSITTPIVDAALYNNVNTFVKKQFLK